MGCKSVGKAWRIAATIFVVCQGALPALAGTCGGPLGTPGRNCVIRQASAAARCGGCPGKAKCSRARRPATAASSCSTCPCRQSRSQPASSPVPFDSVRRSPQIGGSPGWALVAFVAVTPGLQVGAVDGFKVRPARSHNDRQSRMACWLI